MYGMRGVKRNQVTGWVDVVTLSDFIFYIVLYFYYYYFCYFLYTNNSYVQTIMKFVAVVSYGP